MGTLADDELAVEVVTKCVFEWTLLQDIVDDFDDFDDFEDSDEPPLEKAPAEETDMNRRLPPSSVLPMDAHDPFRDAFFNPRVDDGKDTLFLGLKPTFPIVVTTLLSLIVAWAFLPTVARCFSYFIHEISKSRIRLLEDELARTKDELARTNDKLARTKDKLTRTKSELWGTKEDILAMTVIRLSEKHGRPPTMYEVGRQLTDDSHMRVWRRNILATDEKRYNVDA